MAKEKVFTGYAVVTNDIVDDKVFKRGSFGISFDGRDLETCKRYCHGNHIVVRTFRKVIAKSITFKWNYDYPRFEISRRHSYPCYIQLWWLRIEFDTIHANGYERTAIYIPNPRKED